MIPEYIQNDFEQKIENHYLEEAKKYVTKRRSKFVKTITFTAKNEAVNAEDESTPGEPRYNNFNGSDEEDFEGGQPTPSKTRNKKKSNKKEKSQNQVIIEQARKIKMEYPKIKTRGATLREKDAKSSEIENFHKACDLFMKENNILFDYQGYDESMQPEAPSEKNPLIYQDHNTEKERADVYTPPTPDTYPPTTHTVYFYALKEYQGMTYVPPIFKEKYELCIWKLNQNNAVKIRNYYFTPEIYEKKPDQEFDFDYKISLDNQTLLLVQTNNDTEKCLVLIFDFYSLEKITEMFVNVCNPALLEDPDYDKDSDLNYPEGSSKCPTASGFDKIQNWNNGLSILVGVGAQPKSK